MYSDKWLLAIWAGQSQKLLSLSPVLGKGDLGFENAVAFEREKMKELLEKDDRFTA